MTKEAMNIHRALSELKILDSRIENAIQSTTFVVANKHSNETINGKSLSQYRESMKSEAQKVKSLIDRRNAMKRAVVLSNASTTVPIGGVEYTVAEAIEMKNHGMANLKLMRTCMVNQLSRANGVINLNSGEALERKAENYVLAVIQAQPKDSKMSIDSDAMVAVRKTYLENNTFDLVDPLYIEEKIRQYDEQISTFDAEVDAVLSTSNALTTIEFEY